MIKGIIFDADGMLIIGKRFSEHLQEKFGITTEDTSDFFRGEFQDCLIGKKDLREELSTNLPLWGWKGTLEDFLQEWFAKEFNVFDTRFIEIFTMLKNKGIKLYLATNNEKHRTDALVGQNNFQDYFDDIFASGYVGLLKPNKDFFEHIVEKTGFTPDELMFWDDDIENIDGARNAGLRCGHYVSFDLFVQELEQVL